jgi:hypothetical protein
MTRRRSAAGRGRRAARRRSGPGKPKARRLGPFALIAVLAAIAGGCATGYINPSFPLTVRDAERAIADMRADPRPLARPVVVLGGIHDPGFAAPAVARRIRKACGDGAPVIAVSFFGASTFDACRQRAVEAVQTAWPSDDDGATVEVDVIGISMGGLVARYAARALDDGSRRLRIHRLFTISTPHRGATLAELPTIDPRALDMRAGSGFLTALNRLTAAEDPPILAYGRLDDLVVGTPNTAMPGVEPIWVRAPFLSPSHLACSHDPRILADILRRIRGEAPYALVEPPAAPVPRREGGQ